MNSGSSSSDNDEVSAFKVIVLGNGSVGKTSLIRRFCESGFEKSYQQTIGLDFYSKRVAVPRFASEVALQIWDIGGQQIGGKMLDNYIYGSDAVFLVYDVTSPASFKDVEDWLACVKAALNKPGVEGAARPARTPIVMLVGNKIDLMNRQVAAATHDAFADAHNTGSFLVSARSGEKVNALFVSAAAQLVQVPLTMQDFEFVEHVTASIDKASVERREAPRVPILHAEASGKHEENCTVM